jgi:antitoxin CptB
MRITLNHQPAQFKMRSGQSCMEFMDRDIRIKRLKFRACHRGTREADMMIGGFFDKYHMGWSETEIEWFEAFLEEQDVDIMGWALGTIPVPARWRGAMIDVLMRLDFIAVSK